MEAATERGTIEREVAISASPETVWEFLVDPEKVTRWMGMTAVFDARPGGSYRIEVCPGEMASGEFLELDPPRRLVYTWGWEPGGSSAVAPGSTTIEIELVPEGDATTLRFLHRGVPSAEDTRSHAHGWDHYLGRLETVASGGDAGLDPWAGQSSD